MFKLPPDARAISVFRSNRIFKAFSPFSIIAKILSSFTFPNLQISILVATSKETLT